MLTRSTSEMSVPMDDRAASRMSCATASSMTTAVMAGRLSSDRSALFRTTRTSRAYWMLSGAILTSSGKCHEYHSRTRMANVLMSLSSVSSSAMLLRMPVSERFTLNLTLERE